MSKVKNIPIATPKQAKDGWTYDYNFLEYVKNNMKEYPCSQESVEEVIKFLVEKGYCK